MFEAVNLRVYEEFCHTRRAELLEAVRNEYLEEGIVTAGKTGKYRVNGYRPCQTSQALALAFRIVRSDETDKAVNKLVSLIHEHGDSFDCGLLGLRYIFRVLSDFGYTDLAYKMITKPSYPSYANMIYRGETTVWERFVTPGRRIGSHNHHMFADISAWYIEKLLGIVINPEGNDANCIMINPHFVDGMAFAEGSYKTQYGSVTVRLEQKESKKIVYLHTSGSIKVKYSSDFDVKIFD